MALTDEDLKFKLTIDPDTAKMQAAVKEIGKDLDEQAAKAKQAWSDLGNFGASQLQAIHEKQKTAAGFEKLGQSGSSQLDQIQGISNALPGKASDVPVDAQAAFHGGVELLLAGFGEISAVLGPLTIALGAIVGAVALATDAFKNMTDSVAGFVAVASPGAFRQWQIVLQDISGVIGQTLVPVLTLLREAFRFFGDVLATLLPTASEMSDMLSHLRPVFEEFTEAVRDLLAEMGPELRMAIRIVFGTIIAAFGVLLKIAADFMSIITKISSIVKGLLGVSTGQIEERSSFGAAAQPAHFTSLEEFGKEIQQAALSASAESPEDTIDEQQLNVLESIESILLQILNAPNAPIETAASLVQQGLDATDDQYGIRRALLGF